MKKKMTDYGEYQLYDYINKHCLAMEAIPATLYDLQFYIANQTTHLEFFGNPSWDRGRTNMYQPNILPNPQAFLVESIRIHGVTRNLQFGACQLIIGAKHYGVNPAWCYGMKEKGFKVRPSILIPPLMSFSFRIDWETAQPIGKGISGVEVIAHPIQVVMFGQMARPIQ